MASNAREVAELCKDMESMVGVLARGYLASAARCEALERALRDWMKCCECHGTGTITHCDWASTKETHMTTRECHNDYCKAARAALEQTQ